MDVSAARLAQGKARAAKAGVGNVQRHLINDERGQRDAFLKRKVNVRVFVCEGGGWGKVGARPR
jgi:hypothetical protein